MTTLQTKNNLTGRQTLGGLGRLRVGRGLDLTSWYETVSKTATS